MEPYPIVYPVRKQSEIYLAALKERLDMVLPAAMREANLDMWLVLCQEDNPDPIFNTLIPMNTWTPILQMLIFYDRGAGQGIERINLSMTDTAGLYDTPWSGRCFEEQWEMLAKIVAERDPQRIGINIGNVNWAAGGLTYNLYQQLIKALPSQFVPRLVSAEQACVRWGETFSTRQKEIYPHIVALGHRVIENCYQRDVIMPGVTTTTDLEWHYWQQVADLGLSVSFKPFFNVVRSDKMKAVYPIEDKVIRRGDLIHCDVGLRYLGLDTDHQEWAYVCREGETGAPAGLKHLFTQVNRLQKVFMGAFKAGLTGNEMLKAALGQAHAEGIPNPKIYSHSLGLFLHEPGPLIGLPWEQVVNPGRGDVALVCDSAFTMELSIEDAVPEWGGQMVRFSCEQDVLFTEAGCAPVDGIQTEFYLI